MKKSTFNPLRSMTTLIAAMVICVCAYAGAATLSNDTPAQSSGTKIRRAESCGAVALAELAQALHFPAEIEQEFASTAPPQGGFSVAELQKLATRFGLALEAARRPAGTEIAMPCIVHWSVGHYGVITERNGSRYRIGDSGGRTIWMDLRQIEAHASGIFLVPSRDVPKSWQRLSDAETAAVRAGLTCPPPCTNYIPDDEDPPSDCCDDGEDQDADCDPPAANDGASSSGGGNSPPPCCCDMGMPRWHVSGYVNLWLIDRPLLYKTTNNKWFPLKVTYKSSGPNRGTNNCGFGPKWECNWLGMPPRISQISWWADQASS